MPQPRRIARYGWKRDQPDPRDHRLTVGATWPQGPLPPAVDLRPHCPPIYDQGQLGSCTANAICAAAEFIQMQDKQAPFAPSRLMLYYLERVLEGTVASDAGAEIRDGFRALLGMGVCSEGLWPYDIAQFARRPPLRAFAQARAHRALEYARVPQTWDTLRSCLAGGLPFVFGVTVAASFESEEVARTGVVPLPQPGEVIIGGHAMLCVGYRSADRTVIVQNSWGVGWGQGGYCFLPADYLTNPELAADFWRLAQMKDA